MIESMILKVITFFVDVGDWFKKNFFHHNPHEVKKVEETIEATPEVKSAKEFMQQSIETVSKAQQDLIDTKTKEIFAKVLEEVAKVEKPVEEVLKEVTATVENVSEAVANYKAELAQFVETETKVAEKLVEEVAEVVEETVKKATRKKTKTEED
jgi:hypothetical protein